MKQFFVYLTIPCQQIELLTYLTGTFYKEREIALVIAVAQNEEEHSIGICRIRLLIKEPKNVSIRLHKDLIAELRREIEQNKINFNSLTSYCSSQSLVEAYLWRTKLGWNI